MTNPEHSAYVLSALKAMGLGIALDDFGTGHSSLSYLHRFPVDTIKIAAPFVQFTDESGLAHTQMPIIRSIVSLASELDLMVVAEGVETEAERDRLIALDCRYGQGFLFSEAMEGDVLQKRLAHNRGGTGAGACAGGRHGESRFRRRRLLRSRYPCGASCHAGAETGCRCRQPPGAEPAAAPQAKPLRRDDRRGSKGTLRSILAPLSKAGPAASLRHRTGRRADLQDRRRSPTNRPATPTTAKADRWRRRSAQFAPLSRTAGRGRVQSHAGRFGTTSTGRGSRRRA